MKRRILFVGEASPLRTGFSTYYAEVIKRIYAKDLFDIAEFGSYMATNDPRGNDIPWKFYGAMPDIINTPQGPMADQAQMKEYEKSYTLNQFGLWRFDAVVADFKPDIVVAIRDWWMDEWEHKSAFRPFFKHAWMACIDGHPQRPEWLDTYRKCDAVLTYSQYGKKVLADEAPDIKVFGVASPGVDTEIFRPLDRAETKKRFGLPADSIIIGTVMRNQVRKLFPELILSFKKLLAQWNNRADKSGKPRPNAYLLLHTSIPDMGWDIPLEVKRNDLLANVLFTYCCPQCDLFKLSTWVGEQIECPRCKCKQMHTPNTAHGLQPKDFTYIYNCMDAYVQTSVCEGWGLPIQEAKACGIPVFATDWTAMSEQVQSGGTPIEVESVFTDGGPGTMQRRAIFSKDDLVKKLNRFFSDVPAEKRNKLGIEARADTIGSWDRTAAVWINLLSTMPIHDRSVWWDRPYNEGDLSASLPKDLSYDDTIRWMYDTYLRFPCKDETVASFAKLNAPLDKIREGILVRGAARNHMERVRCYGKPKEEHVINNLDPTDTFRILYVMPKTAGDILMSTAVVAGIKQKYPKASIYFACEEKYKSILEGNPNIKSVLPYNDALLNYRVTEGSSNEKGNFDITFAPGIITQQIPHIWHNGHGPHMVDAYAAMCDVSPDWTFIKQEPFPVGRLPKDYVTVHTGSSFDLKNYSYWGAVATYLKCAVIHVGDKKDPDIQSSNIIDLRGKTTTGQIATIIAGAKLHMGVDSFPAHVAAAVGTQSLTLFGATFANQCKGYGKNVYVLEPKDRNGCFKPCHYAQCIQWKKCIDNIKPETEVVAKLRELIPSLVREWPKPKLSAYTIALNCLEGGFPIDLVVDNCLAFADEIIVVDGGSTDGTWGQLQSLKEEFGDRLVLHQSPWDYSKADMMGRQKTLARKLCTGQYLWQTDADEFVPEWQHGAIRDLITNHPNVVLFDLPCVSFSGGMTNVGRTENFYKWRLSKNIPGIIHGVHAKARIVDADGNVTFNREESDSCEYIWEKDHSIVGRFPPLDDRLWKLNAQFMDKEIPQEAIPEYSKLIAELCNGTSVPVVYHYAWVDYKRKAHMARFWSKMKRQYKNATETTREGKWLDKANVSDEDIAAIEKKFLGRKTFYVPIKTHPKEALMFGTTEKWNQHDKFHTWSDDAKS